MTLGFSIDLQKLGNHRRSDSLMMVAVMGQYLLLVSQKLA